MNALAFLKQQHGEVAKLFSAFESSASDAKKLELFKQIADDLAVHATIEERHFYPAVRARDTKKDLVEAYDEHLEVKKLLVDCLGGTTTPGFDGKVAALKGAVEHHVGEEENVLFPKVKKLLNADQLEAIGQALQAEAELLKSAGAPRKLVQVKIEPPAATA